MFQTKNVFQTHLLEPDYYTLDKWKLLNGIGQTDRETVNKFKNLAKALFQALVASRLCWGQFSK